MFNYQRKRENNKKYYLLNKERILKNNKNWRQNHKEQIKKYRQKYYKKYKEQYNQKHKEWYQKNKEKQLFCSKKYYIENKDKRIKQIIKWQKDNKEKYKKTFSEWQKKRRKNNPQYRLNRNMGNLMWHALKSKKMNKHWEKLVNYTIQDLKNHLEKRFDDKMNWNNYGSYWQVDHIKPRSLFKYETAEDPEFKECWALENLQPLEAMENNKKKNKYEC